MINSANGKLMDLLAKIAAIQNYYFEEGREFELPLDINQINTGGDAAIHVAARDLDPVDIFLLLDNEADPNLIGEFGATPLHCAASSKRLDNFIALLQRGADPNLRMYQGVRPTDMILDDELRLKFMEAIDLSKH